MATTTATCIFLLGRSVVAIDYLTQGSKVIVHDDVSALACHAGHLYYACKGHLYSYRIADKTTKVIASTVGTRPNAIYIDRRGYLWAADGSGLYKISVQSRRVLRFYEAGKAGLGEVGFTDIREDCNGRIYVASVGGGIYRLDEKKHAFQVFDTDNSDIMSNFCYAFANVGKQLIYSTEHGIGVLNTTDDSFRNVEFSHDFPIIGINRGCGLFAFGNTILVGGTNGMVAMDVSRLLDTRTHQVYHLHVLSSTSPRIECWFDKRQMQKVVYNLVSNAFKYVSQQTGTIEVQLDQDDRHALSDCTCFLLQ